MVQVWKSASQVLAFSFTTYPPKREEIGRMKFCEIQNAFYCWEGSWCILYTDNGMHRVRMEPMAGHFFCFPTSFFFAPCFWSRLGQNSSGTLPCGSTKLMFFGFAILQYKKVDVFGSWVAHLHRWGTIVCNAGGLQVGGGAMQCNAGKALRQVEVKKFILRRQLQESPGLMAVRSTPPEDVLQLWLPRGPIVVSRVYSLVVFLFVCLSVCLFVCLFVYLFVCVFVCLLLKSMVVGEELDKSNNQVWRWKWPSCRAQR